MNTYIIKRNMFVYTSILLFGFIACNNSCTIPNSNYNILDYGAIGDGKNINTASIQKAINKCFKDGGGKVIIPPGEFLSGTIILKTNVELHLQSGAILKASTKHEDFPEQPIPSYRSYQDAGGWYALIYAEGANNIALTGKGTIDGQGAYQKIRPHLSKVGSGRDGRPRNLLLISCKRIRIEGLHFRNSGIWNIHLLNSEDIHVANLNIYNHSNRNNDGIDIDGCRRVVLSGLNIDSDDDGIVLKSTGLAPCENITITNCIVSSYCNAIKAGTESTGGFRNININNCIIKPSRSKKEPVFNTPKIGITALSLEIVDGGIMEGINISDIIIEGTECPIYIRLGDRARKHTKNAKSPTPGQMKNITLHNILAYKCGNYTSSITGTPGNIIENIKLSNITIENKGGLKSNQYLNNFNDVKEDIKGYPQPTVWKNLPASGFFIRHVRNGILKNISLSSIHEEKRPIFMLDDAHHIQIKDVFLTKNMKGMLLRKRNSTHINIDYK